MSHLRNILTTLLIALTSLVMFSSTSFAGWIMVSESINGNTFYVDLARVRKADGYVYFWELTDYFQPKSNGVQSVKAYVEGDCKLFRERVLQFSFHKEQMGGGFGEVVPEDNVNWRYPAPNTSDEAVLSFVCTVQKHL